MADVLKRLGSTPLALTTTAATVYTAPASTTTTVTAIHVANEGAAPATFTLSVGADGAGKRFFYGVTVYVGDSFDWGGQLVLAAGEVLQAYASAATALTLTVSGVETA
jgi:hypothetical protein